VKGRGVCTAVREMNGKICKWDNLRFAHLRASRGKRGREVDAVFEGNLADNLPVPPLTML